MGYQVINIYVIDNDIGSQGDVFYVLNGGNIGSSFNINGIFGVIIIVGKIDCEIIVVYDLIVKVFDGVVEEKVCFIEEYVMVYIFDFNDNVLQFMKDSFIFFVKEIVDINDVIFRVGVLDCDVGENVVL